MFEHSDINIKMFSNPVLPVRNIIKFKQTWWKRKFIWLTNMQAEKILQYTRIYIPWDITELKNLPCKFCGRIFIFLICFYSNTTLNRIWGTDSICYFPGIFEDTTKVKKSLNNFLSTPRGWKVFQYTKQRRNLRAVRFSSSIISSGM